MHLRHNMTKPTELCSGAPPMVAVYLRVHLWALLPSPGVPLLALVIVPDQTNSTAALGGGRRNEVQLLIKRPTA